MFCSRGYKNNNGNSSLGLVPIHRFQPRLLTTADYCYSDRLRHRVRDPFFATPDFLVLPVTAEPSGCPFVRFKADFRDEVSFRRWRILPEGNCISFREPGAEALHLLKPCDSIFERTFPVFADFLNIMNAKFIWFRLRLSWCADPKV